MTKGRQEWLRRQDKKARSVEHQRRLKKAAEIAVIENFLKATEGRLCQDCKIVLYEEQLKRIREAM